MYLKIDRLRDVDISKLLAVYEQSLDYKTGSRWAAQNAFYEDLRLFFACSGAFLAVLEVDGGYVSAVRIEPYEDGYLISCLETAPEHRRKGYATLMLNSVMHTHPGVFYAHVDKRNKASMALHRKLGFSMHLDYAVYADGSVYANSCTLRK